RPVGYAINRYGPVTTLPKRERESETLIAIVRRVPSKPSQFRAAYRPLPAVGVAIPLPAPIVRLAHAAPAGVSTATSYLARPAPSVPEQTAHRVAMRPPAVPVIPTPPSSENVLSTLRDSAYHAASHLDLHTGWV